MGVIELSARATIDDIKNAPQTFSSWDKCMAKAYCKWPVIVGIVIGSIIILSILFCLFRCLCCGLECCCGCFSCFNHCCPSPRKKRSKYSDGPSYQPNPYHGYQPAPRQPPVYEAPQYAQFDASTKKVHEDSLPAMPSWDNAATKKVEDDTPRDDMEMNSMKKEGAGATAAGLAAASLAGSQNRYNHGGANAPNPYGSSSPTRPYAVGAAGANFSRPSVASNTSYGSQQSTPYANPQNAQQYSPTSQTRPLGGFRNPASSDQFQPSAIAPTPSQWNTGYSNYSSSTFSGPTRYEPSTQYGQESGVTQASPTSPRNETPGILQAGRKPAPGTWKDI